MKTLILRLTPDKIVGKQRPRVTKHGTAYTPSQTVKAEDYIRDAYISQLEQHPDYAGPVKVKITTCRQLARTVPKKRLGEPDLGKPDADNVAKLVLDAINGIAFKDDSQVTDLTVIKEERTAYGTGNKLSIAITYMEDV